MSREGISIKSLGVLLCVAMLSVLLPGSSLAADQPKRNYVVTLDIAGADARVVASGRSTRQRIRNRARRVGSVTNRLAGDHGFRPRYRFERAVSGFSARLTAQQAARVARDGQVATVRPARRFRPSNGDDLVPRGVRRVKAAPGGSPAPDVDADIAVLDTGVGPVGGGELNIAGGINCAQPPDAPGYDPDDWRDSIFNHHGTHVAGIAAARDNGIGAVGVAPGARIWAVRVFQGAFGDEATIVCGLLWAISTHDGPDAPPGTQPIEVINMSLQGPRPLIVEECPGAPEDIMHAAICAAEAVGITIVVAAGNNARNARNTAPAGYDQVITVGGLSDFDGTGYGQATSDCARYPNERDDAYASYSNWGSDIDIVAPGTCVTSTDVGNGHATRVLTGTSMSSPHVAGAVARYLAAHPGTSPAQMRRILRGAGRMDWNPKTDPLWSGAADPDEPNRVLDVAALVGGKGLRVWLRHTAIGLGGDETRRLTRVDLQRKGGYAGDVDMGTSGLPASARATFGDSSLDGLSARGTSLELSLRNGGPDGVFDVSITADGSGGHDAGRTLDLSIDRTGPAVTSPVARLRDGRVALPRNGAATAVLRWRATDALHKVASMRLQRKIGAGPWRLVGKTARSPMKVVVKPRQRNQFRVSAADSLGNRTRSAAVTALLSVRDSRSTRWIRPASGGWRTRKVAAAVGGSLIQASRPAAGLRTSFAGKAIAVVAPIGPARGTLRLRVDGGAWQKISLKAIRAKQRRVVYSKLLTGGRHTLEIEGFRGATAIDALLILR